jgi:hypothetical protein
MQLDRDDKAASGSFLSIQFSKHLEMGETKAAELAGIMISKSDRSIRDWRSYFYANDGQIPESK